MGFVRDITGQTARDRSQKAAQQAAQAQQQGAQTQADYQQQALDYLQGQMQLPTEIRNQALQQLGGMFTGQTPGADIPLPQFQYDAPTQSQMVQQAQDSPLYQALMGGQQAGEEAILRQAAATGGLRGGNVQGALAQQASDIQRDALLRSYGEQQRLDQQGYGRAADAYGRGLQQYGLQQDLLGRQLSGLQGLAGMGTGAGQIAGLMGGIGQTLGQGQAGAGQTLAQGKIAGEQARQQALGGLLGTAGQLGGAFLLSDRRLKTNIKRLGDVGSIGWYSWDWLPESGMAGPGVGLLADEVEQIAPEAVTVGSDGYQRVDYHAALTAARGKDG